MISGGKTIILALGSFVLCTGARAVTSGDFPYEGITNRNVFNLRALDDPTQHQPPPTPPSKITLTGITTITGKQAHMTEQPKPGQPVVFHDLAEGQAEGGIEVVSIDEKAEIVKIRNRGMEQTLDFQNDGAKFTGGAPSGPIGTPTGIPSPYGNPANPNGVNPLRTIPTRTLRTPTLPGMPGAGGVPSANGAPGYGANGYGAITPNGTAVNPQQQTLTPDEQAILIEAQREQLKNEGRADMANLLPPTQFSQPGDQNGQSTENPGMPNHGHKFPGQP